MIDIGTYRQELSAQGHNPDDYNIVITEDSVSIYPKTQEQRLIGVLQEQIDTLALQILDLLGV